MDNIIGIDVGAKGALALLSSSGSLLEIAGRAEAALIGFAGLMREAK